MRKVFLPKYMLFPGLVRALTHRDIGAQIPAWICARVCADTQVHTSASLRAGGCGWRGPREVTQGLGCPRMTPKNRVRSVDRS